MDKSLFKYIWQHSRRDQILICAVVLLSLPFYYLSLDLPRRIVNEAIQGKAFDHGNETVSFLSMSFQLPAWLGGANLSLFQGIQVDRIELLFGLSLAFLVLVLVNGAFKYWINLAKGALGERMLRRMRFELFNLVLRFRPEALKYIKSAETATIIKDEVEPIGGFIGDAFILPMFLGAQAATALIFIIIQSEWLGLMAAAVVGIQIIVIPRLRRKLLVLGRKRQLASRRLAGRIGEVFDGQEAVRLHSTADWERAEIGSRLYELFDVRYQIYKRKFVVKFLNNLLAQMTPFLFYAIGGYFAVTGRMDIGQLVAVIGAYRDLPPPLKELIDWDQQRLDVQVKYDQIVQQFAPDRLLPARDDNGATSGDIAFSGSLKVSHLKVVDAQGGPVLNDISFDIPLPSCVALSGQVSGQATALARVLAQPGRCTMGRITIGDVELTTLPDSIRAREIACVTSEPVLFPGSIRNNLVYGLKSRHIKDADEIERLRLKRQTEAKKTGNPATRPDDIWIDYAEAGVSSAEELDHLLLGYLRGIGLGEDIYRFGQFETFNPERYPIFAERLVEARMRFHERLRAAGADHLVETFNPMHYNTQATVAENLLFGVPTRPTLIGDALAGHPGFCRVLNAAKLADTFVDLGARIAETMVEIFRDLTPGHPLFEQFSFLSADDLDDYSGIVSRWQNRRRSVTRAERTQLVALTLNYIEPRHRLGLLDDDLRAQIVHLRVAMRTMLEKTEPDGVEFYEAHRICPSASLRDNILFGRINLGIADARHHVAETIRTVIEELDLRQPVERIGLNHQVGTAGRLLTAQQRAGIDIVRSLVKRPDILILDGALTPFTLPQQKKLRAYFQDNSRMMGKTLIMTVSEQNELQGFDFVVNLSSDGADVRELSAPDEAEPLKVAAQ